MTACTSSAIYLDGLYAGIAMTAVIFIVAGAIGCVAVMMAQPPKPPKGTRS